MSNLLNDAAGCASLLTLAEDVLKQTQDIVTYLRANNIPEPTFAVDSDPTPESAEYSALQSSLTASLEDLQRLVEGPRKFLRSVCLLGLELTTFQIALDFDFFTIVAPGQEISVSELAKKAGLDADRTRRTVNMLMTHRFFQESRPGWISHSSSSVVLFQDPEIRAAVHYW
ncbi:hypothetical protein NUW58_g1278 [Xylaria curta]|uniref:Uncharacterized protein n=1 Tax=Xylaria curta TaxID=42375 RepID=A0ACC1PMI9_9PEZI|nr:hypothetical protein NUW58_g1278 [Xylaria curta]